MEGIAAWKCQQSEKCRNGCICKTCLVCRIMYPAELFKQVKRVSKGISKRRRQPRQSSKHLLICVECRKTKQGQDCKKTDAKTLLQEHDQRWNQCLVCNTQNIESHRAVPHYPICAECADSTDESTCKLVQTKLSQSFAINKV